MKTIVFASFCCLLIGVYSCDKSTDVIPSQNNQKVESLSATSARKFSATADSLDILNGLRRENVVFFDARVRAHDKQRFIKEVVVLDFSPQKNLLKEVVMYHDMAYVDNGTAFDLRAGDGVYTSVETFAYNDTITPELVRGTGPVSVLRAPVAHIAFTKDREAAVFARSYQVKGRNPGTNPTGLVKVECDVTIGAGNCYAVKWGLCSSCCIIISNCKVSAEI